MRQINCDILRTEYHDDSYIEHDLYVTIVAQSIVAHKIDICCAA